MVKLVYCFARRPDLSIEPFAGYWQNVHGPIGARIPGVRRLVQSLAIHDSRDAHAPSFDGMAELWFDDVESVLRARSSPEWEASTADERHFIDHSRTAYFLSRERTIVGSDGTGGSPVMSSRRPRAAPQGRRCGEPSRDVTRRHVAKRSCSIGLVQSEYAVV